MERMDDLVQFLHTRLDEDEQTARAVEDGSAPWDGQWVADGSDALRTRNGHVLAYGHRTTDGRDLPVPLRPGLVDHVARHDPARVLAEVDAKRQTVARHVPERRRLTLVDAEGGTTSFAFYVCTACTPNRTIEHGQGIVEWPCPDARVLALPYADHPDYRGTWRP